MNPLRLLRLNRSIHCVSVVAFGLALTACGSKPPAPAWQSSAKSASDRAVQAYFEGDVRVEQAEFARARTELARTGDAAQLARLELLRCAAQVASLDIDSCTAFEPLAQDASVAERAYARYLEGRAVPADLPLLPEAQRVVAKNPSAQAVAALSATDPLATLVAAGVIFTRGEASPALVELAVETASKQGWSRPLLAWLGVQLTLAKRSGSTTEAARIQRRMDIVAPMPSPREK